MIMPEDSYGMERRPHTPEDNDFVNQVCKALLDVTRHNDASVLQLLGAIEFAKTRLCEMFDKEEE